MFSDRLAEALKTNQITGNALCKRLGMENRNYTNWRNNKIPRGETLKQIADVLNVSTDWLLEREGANTPDEEKLLRDYKDTDTGGKRIILNTADIEAKRSGSDREQADEPLNNTTKKINFFDLAMKQNPNHQEQQNQEDNEELKPFA